MKHCALTLLTLLLSLAPASRAAAAPPEPEPPKAKKAPPTPLQDVSQAMFDAVPTAPEQCLPELVTRFEQLTEQLDRWGAEQTYWELPIPGEPAAASEPEGPEDVLRSIESLLAAGDRAEAGLERLMALRAQFQNVPRGDERRDQIRNFLKIARALIDASGRTQYSLRYAAEEASFALSSYPADFERLTSLLARHESEAGAEALAYVLFPPPAGSDLKPFPPSMQAQVLRLMAQARAAGVIPDLARYVKQPRLNLGLKLSAADVICRIGLPQLPHRHQDPSIEPPPIAAPELLRIVAQAKLRGDAPPALRELHQRLLEFLESRVAKGVQGDEFRYGRITVRPGDWFLMRNPSPFNMFTDLAPGLFTHVGVVTTWTDEQGVRRFVITDIPERGDRVPATNLEAYIAHPLHYFFLRHDREEINRQMADAAAATIGNESQFDLLFRTERVLPLRNTDLRKQRVHTYCAGYLLLCALQTAAPREEFFPISEYPPTELCQQNLATLGLNLGAQYISPTGPLFSKHHRIVARRRPQYDAAREIQTAVYDHFGESMAHRTLYQSPTVKQLMLAKVAGISRYNPWLARALAKAHGVSPRMDLESAAKAAAVIETLDEVARAASAEYRQAGSALRSSDQDLAAEGWKAEEISLAGELRARHSELLRRFERDELSGRDLRIELVKYYQRRGRQMLDERFFPDPPGK